MNKELEKVNTKEAISLMNAQAAIAADQKQRVEQTLAEMKKIFAIYQTDMTVVMTLCPGQYPTAEIRVVAK